jgi:hypothetical protein
MLALESWRHLAHEAVHFLRNLLTGEGLAPDETLRVIARGEKKDGGETWVV